MRLSRVLLVLPLLALPVACGQDDPDDVGTGTSTPTESTTTDSSTTEGGGATGSGGLEVTRADGSSFEIDGPFTVECGESDEEDGVTVVRASTPYFNGGPLGAAGAYVEFDPTKIDEEGRTYELPIDGSSAEGDAAIVFVYELNAPGRNELNSDRGDSSGTVRVVTATCDPVPRLVVEVDATLGSELSDGEPAEVVGDLDLTGS